MSFRDQLERKADRIYSLAMQRAFGPYYIEQNGADWYRSFGWFVMGDPDEVDSVMDDLTSAISALTRNDTATLNQITITMDHWTGDAADSFRSYAGSLLDAVEMQQDVINALHAIADAHKDIVTKARQDILAVADAAIAALEDEGGGTNWAGVFTVVGAAAVLIGGIASGGALAVVAAAVEASAGIAAASVPQSQDDGWGLATRVTSGYEVLEALEKAIFALENAVKAEEAQLRAGLKALADYLASGPVLAEIRPQESVISKYPMSPSPTTDAKSWDLTDFELATED